GRLDSEYEQRPGQVRPVQVGSVAADELRAGEDDRGVERQAVCTPLAVTFSTTGFNPESGTCLPPTTMTRVSGELTLTHNRLPGRRKNGVGGLPFAGVP